MDLLKLKPEVLSAVLKWCQKRNLKLSDLKDLFELIEKPDNGGEKKGPGRPRDTGEGGKKKHHDYRALRLAKKKTQGQVCEDLGMTRLTLRKIENGKGAARQETLARLNKYYGVE